MSSTLHPYVTPNIKYEYLNWVASDPMPRDIAQSLRLHEPDHRINTIDPITGEDIENVTDHPWLADGNLTVYFESEATRKAYSEQEIDHPNAHLPFPASDDDDRGG
jgi:hypothetical protein